MNNDKLKIYLEACTGGEVALSPVPETVLRGLPLFLRHHYRFQKLNWLAQQLVLAQMQPADAPPSISQIKTQQRNLATHFGLPVVFVFPSLDTYHRNRFIQEGIAFIVPGLQLFIPPFAAFCEKEQRRQHIQKFSAAAQAVVLSALYKQTPNGTLMQDWARILGYSAMTLSKVRQELASVELCAQEAGRRLRGMHFTKTGHELWNAAMPYLRAPVKNRLWGQLTAKTPKLIPAGLTALSGKTMLQDDPVQTYACERNAIKALTKKHHRLLEYPDDATAQIEIWIYAPALFAVNGAVDPLSLYLSLMDSPDERVQQALTHLMEQMQW